MSMSNEEFIQLAEAWGTYTGDDPAVHIDTGVLGRFARGVVVLAGWADEVLRQAAQADEALVLTQEDARSWKAQANHNLGKWEAAEIKLGESRRRALDGVASAIRGSEKVEAERDNLREVLETSVGCWEEDARGWRDVLSYFNAQPDADRHNAKELIAAIEQRASTVAENARVARAALGEDA